LFYGVGAICFFGGLALFIPTAAKILQFADPIMVLGAPIFFNGLLLCLLGISIAGTGRIMALVDLYAKPKWEEVAFGEPKTIVQCRIVPNNSEC